ncbi:MAG: 3-hydroxybutyryl-CoA dehydrogenase [Nitrospirae bacterium]|nr:3-hydroxybutyryl-CoA dehydrogenase [Nitrospirota bacterium]
MNLEQVRNIGIVGSGQMGSGIAQVCATAGYSVWLQDVSTRQLEKALSGIRRSLERLASKKVVTDDQAAGAVKNIRVTEKLEDLASCQFVIEAITESPEAKLALFRDLDHACPPEVVLASNTSSIPITKLGAATRRPPLVVGMHFMNPPPLMKLVEVVPGLDTSDQTSALTRALAEKLGKTPVCCVEQPGFIVNRILLPMINEAIYALQEGLASADDIDKAMKLGTNQPMGPLALADLIGLDVCLAILEVMHREIGDPKYRPAPLLRKYVDAGHVGRKSGRGFYRYAAQG